VYPAEPGYASIEAKLQTAPAIAVPTITVDGKYEHRVFPVGHNVQREAPGPSSGPSWASIVSSSGS
jgi:hypothetical protein